MPLDLDATNALGGEQALDPVDVRRSFADQTFAFTVRAAEILLLDAWY